jgi:sugar phosphate permease
MKSKAATLQAIAQPKGNMRWTVAFWLLLGGIINYLDRANLSIAAPEIIKELNFTTTDIGLMGAFFSWAYAFGQLPSGWLVDRLGAKRVYAAAITWWSAATAATGLCSTMSGFLPVRAIMGVSEAPCFPISAKITSYWFPKHERSMASGIWDASSKVGPAIAAPILVTLMIAYGWRALFYITGALGIVFVIFFWKYYNNPEQSKRISQEELDYIKAHGVGVEKSSHGSTISWRSLFKYRSVWGMIIGYFCVVWLFNIFINFLPLFLMKTQHISLKELGIYASIPWIGGIVGDLLGGYVVKKAVDAGFSEPITAKKAVISLCALSAGGVAIAVPFAPDLFWTIVLMTIAIAFVSAITGNIWALAADIAPPSMVASVGSIQNFGGYFGGALSPIVVGLIVDSTGSFLLAFVSGGIVACCAAIGYWFIVKDPITEPAA